MYYVARWYDPVLGRFAQADSLVPGAGNPRAWDRFAYGINNPLRYNDPTGHWFETALDIISLGITIIDIAQNGLNWENGLSLVADVVSVALPVVTGGGLIVKAVVHADDVIDVAQAVNQVDNVTDALSHVDEVTDAVQGSNQTLADLYAFGNTSGVTIPKPKDFPGSTGLVGPESPPFPSGGSTFANPQASGLGGHYWKLPQGTQLPDGVNVIADGVDVNPLSPHPPTHHTIYPTQTFSFDEFSQTVKNLPWQYAGKVAR